MQHGDAFELILAVIGAVFAVCAARSPKHRIQALTTEVNVLQAFCNFIDLNSRRVGKQLPYAHFVLDSVTSSYYWNTDKVLLMLALM